MWPGAYLSLHTGTPTTTGNELTGRGYARTLMTNRGFGFDFMLDAMLRNTPTYGGADFPDVTAAWTTPTHFAVWSDARGSVLLASGAITPAAPASPSQGNYRVPANALTLTFDAA